MTRRANCTHKTVEDHSALTQHTGVRKGHCEACENTRTVRRFKNGHRRDLPCDDCGMVVNVRVWRCSLCERAQPWSPTWGYFGNLECTRCGTASIDAVFCSGACFRKLRAKPQFAKLKELS